MDDCMQIIDSHTNITPDGVWLNPKFEASFDLLKNQMEQTNTEKAVLVSLSIQSNFYIQTIINDSKNNSFKGVGFIDFSRDDFVGQASLLLANGFSGVKVHPRLQGINLCEKKYQYFWEFLNSKNCILLIDGYFHLANNSVMIKDLYPLNFEPHIAKYSKINFIYAHCGFHKVMDVFFLCKSYANFYTNLSYSLNYIEKTSFYKDYEFLIEHCDRKVLFGSDFPEVSIKKSISDFLKLSDHLQDDKKNNILFNNAFNLFWR